ncbi:MAG: MFS transporter [Burkholderiales bacterium]|nr:MFS transporter [Burkholderiales bacterium]
MNKSRAYLQWSFVQLFFVVSVIFSVMFGVYSPNITSNLSINQAQFGWLSGIFFIFYAVVQFYSGKLFVKLPPRAILFVSALISAGGCFILSMAPSLTFLLIARILLGIGLAATYVGVLYIIQKNFLSTAFPVMSSLSQCLANLAGTSCAFFGGIIITYLNYNAFFIILAIAFVICAICMLAFVKDNGNNSSTLTKDSSLVDDMKIILKNAQVWWAAIFFTGLFGAIISFANLFATSFQVNAFDISTTQAVAITSMILLGVTIGSVLAGIISDRLNNYAFTARVFALISMLSFIIVLYVRLNFLPHHSDAFMVYFIFGFGLGGSVLAFQGIQENVVEENLRPLATSFVLTISYIFTGFVEQPIIGQILNSVKVIMTNVSPEQLALLHGKTFLDLNAHDELYRYSAGLTFVLLTLIASFIASLFLKKPMLKN